MSLLIPWGITSLTVNPPSLESLFLRLYVNDNGGPDVGHGDADGTDVSDTP